MDILTNKVSESGLITIDLADFYPSSHDIIAFDFHDYLFMGLILKEKDFRLALQNLDTTVFLNKYVTIFCSTDAIIPMWANMLVVSTIKDISKGFFFGTIESAYEKLLLKKIEQINPIGFSDKRVVVKGCGDFPIPASAYITITSILLPYIKSIMYGEPCSTVPIFKKK